MQQNKSANIGHKSRQNSTSAPAGLQPIKDWQQQWERYLWSIHTPHSTLERYSRAVQRFLDHFKDKPYPSSILRPHVIDYRDKRLKDGASPSTVRLELSAVRAFWEWMMAMQVVDALFNPAKGVKVPTRPKSPFVKTASDGTIPSGEKSELANASTGGIMSPCSEGGDSSDGDSA